MDEIFGEENFVVEIIWTNNERGRSIDKFISNTNEYILVFTKNINNLVIQEKKEIGVELLEIYNQNDGISQFKKGDPLYNNNSSFNIETRPNLVYSIYVNLKTNEKKCVDEKIKLDDGSWYLPTENLQGDEWTKIIPPLRNTNNKIGCWRWGMPKFMAENETELVLKKETKGNFMFYSKNRLDNENAKYSKFKNVISSISGGSGTTELINLLNDKIFDHPKPSKLIKLLIEMGTTDSDLILDFFAGSGTTGDAVMQLNAEDGGNRKFILVQIPEPIDPKKNKVAFDFVNELALAQSASKEKEFEPTIFEITKERLLRAAKKINTELDEKSKNLQLKIKKLETELQTEDIKTELKNKNIELKNIEKLKAQNSFKIFETMPIWEDYEYEEVEFNPNSQLFDFEKLTEYDLKALLTTWKTNDNIPLTENLITLNLGGYLASYGKEKGKLYLMNKGFTTDNLVFLLEKIDSDREFNPTAIIAFGYHFDSKNMREIAESIKSYRNKKSLDIDYITRY